MDFYRTRDNYILRKEEHSLWCNRANGNLKIRPASTIGELQPEPKCSGTVYGVVGKVQFLPGSDPKLVLITKRSEVGKLRDHSNIFRIDRIAVVPLSAEECFEIDLDTVAGLLSRSSSLNSVSLSMDVKDTPSKTEKNTRRSSSGSQVLLKALLETEMEGLAQLCEEHKDHLPFKQTTNEAQPRVTQTFNNLKASLANQFKGSTKTNTQKAAEKEFRDKEKLDKLERRLQEEFVKMFNDSESFYYSENGDLTNTLQRNENKDDESRELPVWKMADERFFWNKAMLEEIITLAESEPVANQWIMPIIQGYVQTANCEIDFSDVEFGEDIEIDPEKFDLVLISRRSVTRAGTRYKRRGVDEEGNVANYVETEQIVCAGHHYLSFVQVRGSIPLYWSQAGIKYRPPPKLEKNKEESQEAMKKHFGKELGLYESLIVINLVDQTGREQILSDALMEQIIAYNNESLTYVTFDFHEYCRGMKFENVSVLVDSLAEITEDIRYCWVDRHGVICNQRGVFRINCMDCLDRTNVVQAALARCVLESQLRKLGRLMPEQSLPPDVRDIYQDMWANNGDAISRQYAGTAAMKGDFTRTGERRFTGVVKDGYHSANRYLNRFTAAYRQTVIDIMLGIPPTEDISLLMAAIKQPDDPGEEWTMQREEWVAQLVEHCQQLLVHEEEVCVGGWALFEPFINTSSCDEDIVPDDEQEVVLLLTEISFYIASYDEEEECVNQYERQPLENLEKIEIGPGSYQKSRHSYLRLHYRSGEDSGFFRTFKALQNRTSDEGGAVLRGIADEFHKVCEGMQLKPKITECRLTKKKSKPHNFIQITSKTRPLKADVPLSSKKHLTIAHSSSAPAELDKFASSMPTHFCPAVNTCNNPVSDKPEGESTGCSDNDTDNDEIPNAPEQQFENSMEDSKESVSDSSERAEAAETAHGDLTARLKLPNGEGASCNAEDMDTEIQSSKTPNITVNGNDQKSKDTDFSLANIKRSFKNRFNDVSIKFQKSKNSENSTEIFWQTEEDSDSTQGSPKPTTRRNIFIAAQERSRTFIPDLKNKLSGLSNRSPKLDQRKDWVQIIKESDCKTRIIQL